MPSPAQLLLFVRGRAVVFSLVYGVPAALLAAVLLAA